jgi:hypothetical protein
MMNICLTPDSRYLGIGRLEPIGSLILYVVDSEVDGVGFSGALAELLLTLGAGKSGSAFRSSLSETGVVAKENRL